MADTLILSKDAVGKQLPLPSHLKRAVCEVIDFDVLTCQAVRQITSFQDDLPAIVGHAELLTYVALFTDGTGCRPGEEPARSGCDADPKP